MRNVPSRDGRAACTGQHFVRTFQESSRFPRSMSAAKLLYDLVASMSRFATMSYPIGHYDSKTVLIDVRCPSIATNFFARGRQRYAGVLQSL